jgi:hypothetical protein
MPPLKNRGGCCETSIPNIVFRETEKGREAWSQRGIYLKCGYFDIFFHFKPHVHCAEKKSRVFRGGGQAALLTLLPNPKNELQERRNPKPEKKTR